MSLVLTEPFNDFTTAPWAPTGAGATIVAGGRRGNGARCVGASTNIKYSIPSGDQAATITIGFAFRIDNITGSRAIMRLDSDSGATIHSFLSTLSDGSLQIKTGGAAGPTIATSATGLVAANTWYYIELQATLSDTVGTIALRLNGATVASATNADTKNAGTKTVYDTVTLLGPLSGVTSLFDDLYLRNDLVFQGDPTVFTASGTGAIVFAGTGTAIAPVVASGSGAIVFAGVGVAAVSLNASGSGAIVFAGVGVATTAFLGGSATLTFDARGTAKISPVIVAGVGHIAFAGRGDIDVEPLLDVYAPPEWTWLVLQPDGTPIGSLTAATGRRLTFQLDGSATASFTMPGDHPQTATVIELATDLYVARNGRPLFRGRIGGSSETHAADTDSVNLTATDYRGLLDHRLLWPGSRLKFNGVDQSDIAWQLIADAQALGDLGITRGVGAVTGVERVREFTAGSGLGQTIKELGNIAGGFDWEIDAELAFNLYCPQRGRYPADVPSEQPTLTYGEEVLSITTTVDPGKYGNAVYFTGATDTDPATAVGTSTPEVGRWELQRADPNAAVQSTIEEEAAAELAASSQLISAVIVTLQPDIWNPYRLWLGDIVRTIVQAGRLNLDVRRRIVQIDVALDDTGVETVALSIGSTPPRLSDRLNSLDKRVSHLELAAGSGSGGGGGDDGGIKEITSIGGTIAITAPTGPTTNLEVASGVGHIAVTNPTGPVVNLEYAAPGAETVVASYHVGVLTDLVTFHEYGFYSFASSVVPWLQNVPFDEAGYIPDMNTGQQLVKITQPGTYTMTVHVSTISAARGLDLHDNEVMYPIFCSFLGLDLGAPMEGFNIGNDAPKTLSAPPVRFTEADLANGPLAGWFFLASLNVSTTRWMEVGAEIALSITLTRLA